jgi:hypothetical protein
MLPGKHGQQDLIADSQTSLTIGQSVEMISIFELARLSL